MNLQEPVVARGALRHVPPAQHRHQVEASRLLPRVRPYLEVADGDRHDVRQRVIPFTLLELPDIRLARVVDDAVDEAWMVDELHFHHERRARPVAAAHIQDRQLGARHQRELLARQVLDDLDGLVARPLEQVVEQAAEDVRVRREDAPKDEVVFQIGEGHLSVVPARRAGCKARRGKEKKRGSQAGGETGRTEGKRERGLHLSSARQSPRQPMRRRRPSPASAPGAWDPSRPRCACAPRPEP